MRGFMAEFGITRLARLTGLDCVGVPVWSAIRPNARTLAQSQGKGIDDDFAMASALMEAVEVATAERDDLPARRASRSELLRAGLTVETCENLLRKGAAQFEADEVVDWFEAEDLMTGRAVYVPYEAATFSADPATTRYWQTSDGLASGNTAWESRLHGLCERIERDAATLWLLRSDKDIVSRCVDPRSFADPVMAGFCNQIRRAGLQLRLFNASCDTKTPVYAAFLSPIADGGEHQWKFFDLSSGWGCHPRPLRAALRAVTEAAQTRLTTISATRDDFDPRRYHEPIDRSLLVYPRATPMFVAGLEGSPTLNRQEFLPRLLQNMADTGVRSVLAVPLERGERGFAVTRILVADLESPMGDRASRFGPRAVKFYEGQR